MSWSCQADPSRLQGFSILVSGHLFLKCLAKLEMDLCVGFFLVIRRDFFKTHLCAGPNEEPRLRANSGDDVLSSSNNGTPVRPAISCTSLNDSKANKPRPQFLRKFLGNAYFFFFFPFFTGFTQPKGVKSFSKLNKNKILYWYKNLEKGLCMY